MINDIVLLAIGTIVGILAGRRWKQIHFSVAAFTMAPLMIRDAMRGWWQVAAVAAGFILVMITIDVVRWRRRRTA